VHGAVVQGLDALEPGHLEVAHVVRVPGVIVPEDDYAPGELLCGSFDKLTLPCPVSHAELAEEF